MVAGLHKAYRCKECGVVFTVSKSNGQVIILGNTDGDSGLKAPKTSKLLTALKKLFGVSTCPQCGSHDVFEDMCIRT